MSSRQTFFASIQASHQVEIGSPGRCLLLRLENNAEWRVGKADIHILAFSLVAVDVSHSPLVW